MEAIASVTLFFEGEETEWAFVHSMSSRVPHVDKIFVAVPNVDKIFVASKQLETLVLRTRASTLRAVASRN